MPPIVLYTGPSMLDDQSIVVLATLRSRNVKTGGMVQIWIMRADMTPVRASKKSTDRSVCGDCPRRHALRGLRDVLGKLLAADCYVLVHNAPQSSWKAWNRAGRPSGDIAATALAIAKTAVRSGVRMGAYGDPAAVPFYVWRDLFAALPPNITRTGYTHQWRSTLFTGPLAYAHRDWCRENLMASCDTPDEAMQASAAGWRYFLAMMPGQASPERSIECLADRDVKPRTCETCGICDGTGGKASRASVYIVEHGARSGAKAKRVNALAVLA